MRRALVAAVAAAGIAAAGAPAAAQARWGPPFDLAPPQTLDVIPPQLALAPDGSAAAALGFQDVDTPGSAEGYLTLRAHDGAVSGPTAVAPARQILDLAYDGGSLELLTGSSPAGQTCCSAVEAIAVSYGAHAADAFGAYAPVATVHSIGELERWLTLHA